MRLMVVLGLSVLCLFGQESSTSLDKAPPDVEDALRARITEFYQDHVDGKYRKAEALVAEEDKDTFYAASKPALMSFKIGEIRYTENHTKAKATIVGKITIAMAGFAGRPLDVPFPSHWKQVNGQWYWYVPPVDRNITPFGELKHKPEAQASAGAAPVDLSAPPVDLNAIQQAVKADRTSIHLAEGRSEQVTLVNTLPGVVTLQPNQEHWNGVAVSVDHMDVSRGGKATITFRLLAEDGPPAPEVAFTVQPTGQVIKIHIDSAR